MGEMEHNSPTAQANERLRQFYNRSAPGFDGWMRYYDRAMLGDGRWRICARARGRTLELAVGTGLNLAYYPREVELTAIDLTPGMLEVARQRARRLGREVTLRVGDAHALDFSAGSFDTVVATLLLSTIPDCRRAAREAWRVLKPGGRFLLLDHVRSPVAPVRWAERLLGPVVSRFTGVHLLRDPLDYLGATGFTVERCRRTRWGVIEEVVARKN
jgi:ubiquinone/menaquinone biosynthesis C-methylase UbiE